MALKIKSIRCSKWLPLGIVFFAFFLRAKKEGGRQARLLLRFVRALARSHIRKQNAAGSFAPRAHRNAEPPLTHRSPFFRTPSR